MPASTDGYEFNPHEAVNRIRGKIRITWCGILAERLALALWQPVTLAVFLAAAASFGIFAVLPNSIIIAVLAATLAGIGFLLIRGFANFQWPARIDAVRRLDASIPEFPITALLDVPATGLGEVGTAAVWHEHQVRMAAILKTVSPVLPKPGIYKKDRFALRFQALTALVAGIVFGPMVGMREISSDGGGAASAQSGFLIEAWVQPPSYTGKPAIYLTAIESDGAISVPESSLAIVRFYGERDNFDIEQSVSDIGPVLQESGLAHEMLIRQSGEIRVEVDGEEEGGEFWKFDVIPDLPPSIELAGEVGSDAGGKLTVPLRLTDDYGIKSAHAQIEIDIERLDRRFGLEAELAEPNSEELEIPLPFFGSRSEIELEFREYFASSRFAGLPVRVAMTAFDDAGQESSALELTLELPNRYFSDPLAESFVELRRDLLWNDTNSKRVAQVSRALSNRPAEFFKNHRVYLLARSAIHTVESGIRLEDISQERNREAAEILWAAALVQEDGNISMARQLMRELAKKLEEAIRKGLPEREIAKLLEEYREAMENFLKELAKRDANSPGEFTELQSSVREAPVDDMLSRLESLIQNGRMDDAADLLASLQDIMDSAAGARQQESGQTNDFQRTVEELQETLENQQDLTDESFRMLRRGQMERGEIAGPSDSEDRQFGSQGRNLTEGGQEIGELAGRQMDLHNRLGDQIGNIPLPGESDRSESVREVFRSAKQSMGRAGDYIASGDLDGAVDEQTEAMNALREGIRGFSEAWQQLGGSEAGPVPSESGIDPFGRRHSNTGLWANEDMLLPGNKARKRIEELREEIRRRSGDTSRTPTELEYLRRLLQRF